MPTFPCQFCFFSQRFHAISAFFFSLPGHQKCELSQDLDFHLFFLLFLLLLFYLLIHQSVNWAKIWTFIFFFFADASKKWTEAKFGLQFSFFKASRCQFIFFFSSLIHQRSSRALFWVRWKRRDFLGPFFLVSDEKKIAGLGGAKIRITPCFSESWRSVIQCAGRLFEWTRCGAQCAHVQLVKGENRHWGLNFDILLPLVLRRKVDRQATLKWSKLITKRSFRVHDTREGCEENVGKRKENKNVCCCWEQFHVNLFDIHHPVSVKRFFFSSLLWPTLFFSKRALLPNWTWMSFHIVELDFWSTKSTIFPQ